MTIYRLLYTTGGIDYINNMNDLYKFTLKYCTESAVVMTAVTGGKSHLRPTHQDGQKFQLDPLWLRERCLSKSSAPEISTHGP